MKVFSTSLKGAIGKLEVEPSLKLKSLREVLFRLRKYPGSNLDLYFAGLTCKLP
jgi:hypothetical protein